MNALALSVSHTLDSSPKVGALGKTGNFAVLPRPLPLGEVASRSDDGEGEPVPGMAGKPAGFD